MQNGTVNITKIYLLHDKSQLRRIAISLKI